MSLTSLPERSNNFYNRYGEYDPDHADMKKWLGRCVKCGEWLQTGEPIKAISIQELSHKFCPIKSLTSLPEGAQ